ncbi:MAG: cupin domain-containing protein [Balneolaceae bacterium]|nr:cupin domain-containing protein [Balneolaceae bacterium]
METIHLEKQGETLIFPYPEDEKTGRLEIKLKIAPGKTGPLPHIHTVSDEGFEVVSGTLIIKIDGKESALKAGEKAVVKAGQVHTFKNGSDSEPVVVKGFIDPAHNFRWFIREMARSANERGGSWEDVSMIQAGYMLFLLRNEYRVGGIPFFMQNIIFGTLALLAKLSGQAKRITPRT